MKKIILTGKIVYWILLIATVVFVLLHIYFSFFCSNYYVISTGVLFNYGDYYIGNSHSEYWDTYTTSLKIIESIEIIMRILRIIFLPIFILVVYFSLKYFDFIKKEKTHKTPYIIAAVTFILLIIQYLLHSSKWTYFSTIILYIIDLLNVIHPYLLFPITIILSKYAAMYIFKKYNKDFEEKLKEQKIRKLRMKLKATEKELNSLQDLQEFNNKN